MGDALSEERILTAAALVNRWPGLRQEHKEAWYALAVATLGGPLILEGNFSAALAELGQQWRCSVTSVRRRLERLAEVELATVRRLDAYTRIDVVIPRAISGPPARMAPRRVGRTDPCGQKSLFGEQADRIQPPRLALVTDDEGSAQPYPDTDSLTVYGYGCGAQPYTDTDARPENPPPLRAHAPARADPGPLDPKTLALVPGLDQVPDLGSKEEWAALVGEDDCPGPIKRLARQLRPPCPLARADRSAIAKAAVLAEYVLGHGWLGAAAAESAKRRCPMAYFHVAAAAGAWKLLRGEEVPREQWAARKAEVLAAYNELLKRIQLPRWIEYGKAVPDRLTADPSAEVRSTEHR